MNPLHKVLAEKQYDGETRARSPTRNTLVPAQRLLANASAARSSQMPKGRVSRSLSDGGWTWFWSPSEYGTRGRREAIAQCRAAVVEDADAGGAMTTWWRWPIHLLQTAPLGSGWNLKAVTPPRSGPRIKSRPC